MTSVPEDTVLPPDAPAVGGVLPSSAIDCRELGPNTDNIDPYIKPSGGAACGAVSAGCRPYRDQVRIETTCVAS